LQLDVVTVNEEVARWLREVTNGAGAWHDAGRSAARMTAEVPPLQAPPPSVPTPRLAIVLERITEAAPVQHPLTVHEQLLMNVRQGVAA
jgi:hypothetical protein